MERGGAAATASAAGAKVFGGSRLKTLFGISKGGGRAPPPESASADSDNYGRSFRTHFLPSTGLYLV